MNITIPHSWLTDFLKTDATPQKIAECLSLCGPSVEKLTKTKDDYLYEIEVTTNRVDCMSVIGIAREAAAILPQFGIKAKFKPLILPEIDKPLKTLPLTIQDSKKCCQRILGIVLDNVNLKPSPQKIQSRLAAAGIRNLNNAVDITNYIMTEIGHPTHVFDYDRIKTKKLILRTSRQGEKIVSLEDKTYTLPGEDIVIDDGTGQIIDLPGIIGTANSIVTNNTKCVIFFLETNNPVKMRRTSMTLGIRTLAATLNEKGVDSETGIIALKRGVQLFKQLTGATVASKIYDLYPKPYQPKTVKTPLQLIKEYLGIDISQKEVNNILESLGFINGQVPSWRDKDINIPQDLVEEIARIYGYHRLPSQIMTGVIPTNYPPQKFKLEYQLKIWLTGMGLTEIYTNSMVSKDLALASGSSLDSHLKIKNALSEDWQYLRRSLVPSHTQSFSAFEIANVYLSRPNNLPEERLQLIISGIKDYLSLKGFVEVLSAKLHTDIKPQYYPNAVVIDLLPIFETASAYPHYQSVSTHPELIEDLTFTLPEKTCVGPILETIKKMDALVKSVKLTSIYQHNFTFTITYQSLSKDLSATDIAPIRQKIVTTLSKQFHTQLIGKI